MQTDRQGRGAPDAPDAPNNLSALLELCEAQQNTIERLQQALSEHEQAESDRHLLKRMLAHELRTPLTAVIGTLHTLALPTIDADKHEELRGKALRQAGHLNAMIDDILGLSDPSHATVERNPQEWIAVSELVEDVRDACAVYLEPSRLRAHFDEGLAIRSVPGRVREILVNLVVNAAKYGPEDAPVELLVTRLPDRVAFEVVDQGPGIPDEVVSALFDPYRRGHDEETEETEGVGLGLYLVKRLVDSLAGSVELVARDGGGTLARVELPQKRLEDTPRPHGRHLEVVSGERRDRAER